MDTDLEIIIKDNNIVLTPANVKAYMIMTLKGKQTYFVNLVYFNFSYNEPVNVTLLCSLMESVSIIQDYWSPYSL